METKCAAFWKHTNVRSDNRIFPCCRFKQPVDKFDGDLDNILHSPAYEDLRQKSLKNIPIKGCEKCYQDEVIGKLSLRQQYNLEYSSDTVSLEYLEIGFDNICNLTCDGCWSEFSSAWAKKENIPKSMQIKNTENITSIPDSVKKILFLGGEPLMTNRHLRFLSLVKNKKDTEVSYNTNGTFLFDSESINLLKEFKTVNVILSIDGYGELNEKVRSGSEWTSILKFIDQIVSIGFNFQIHTVLHINNWRGLCELEKFVETKTKNWRVNFLTYPEHLDIINEPAKEELVNILKSIKLVDVSHIITRLGVNFESKQS